MREAIMFKIESSAGASQFPKFKNPKKWGDINVASTYCEMNTWSDWLSIYESLYLVPIFST